MFTNVRLPVHEKGDGDPMRKFALIFPVLWILSCSNNRPPEAPDTTDAVFDQMVARAQTRMAWPGRNVTWPEFSDEEKKAVLKKPICAVFEDHVFPPPNTDKDTAKRKGITVGQLEDIDQSLRTDGLLVVRNGKIIYERYEKPYAGKANRDRLHPVWSAAKSFTTGILAAVSQLSQRKFKGEKIEDAVLTRAGKPVVLTTTMAELFEEEVLNADVRFKQITVEQLLAMAPNLEWSERYNGKITQSSIINMLWLGGYADMSSYAAKQKIGAAGPGTKFNYSSGNALIAMRALKKLYGKDYDRMPWKVLFDKIGMDKVVFEKDKSGVFVGSSYLYMSLRDMAKFGFLYLNGGYYNREQILDPAYLKGARQLSVGMLNGPEEDIEEEKGFYSLGFWINPSPAQVGKVKKLSPKFRITSFFPKVPNDVMFAAGHFGQSIVIYPKQDLLLVRMGHDQEYWSKLDNMMGLAKECFADGDKP